MSTPDGTWDPEGDDLASSLFKRTRAGETRPSARRRGGARGTGTGRRGRRRAFPGTGWSGPGADERDPQPLADAMDRLVGEHGWGREVAVHGVVGRWESVVGREVAAHVRPETFVDGDLVVRADSTAWATQVRMLTGELRKRLDAEVGVGTVTSITVLGPQTRSWSRGPRRVPGRGPRDTYG